MFLQDVEKLVHWGQAIKMPIACCLDAAHTVNLKLGLVYNNIFNKALNPYIHLFMDYFAVHGISKYGDIKGGGAV